MSFYLIAISSALFVMGNSYALHPRCQSEERCFYITPDWDQGSHELEEYVGDKIDIDGYEDQGLCAPTSAAILLKGVLDERHPETELRNIFLEGYNSRPWYENVYTIGMRAQTDFEQGGTASRGIYKSYKDYFKKIKAEKSFLLYEDGIGSDYSDVTNNDVINQIKNFKFGYYISVDKRIKKTKSILGAKQTWYEYDVGHALVIKGFDGDRLQIHDPWGYQYFVSIKREDFKRNRFGLGNTQSVFKPVGIRKGGWMNRDENNAENVKLVLDTLIGISID